MIKGRSLSGIGDWTARSAAPAKADVADEARRQTTLCFGEYATPLKRYLVAAFGASQDAAEDVVQETFLRMYDAFCSGQQIETPRAWVYVAARRLMRDRLELQRNDVAKVSALSDVAERAAFATPENVLAQSRRYSAVRDALRRLAPLERRCVIARYRGLKLREIAQVEEIDLRRVAEIVASAITRMREHLRVEK